MGVSTVLHMKLFALHIIPIGILLMSFLSVFTNEQTMQQIKNTEFNNSSEVEWGAYVGQNLENLKTFELLVGDEVNIYAIFINWNADFPFTTVPDQLQNKTLLIFWEQYEVTLDSIIEGDSDFYIKQFASDANAYGGDVILAPLHEMNANAAPWAGSADGNTPEKVVTAWRHIIDEFGDSLNVNFAWTVNNISIPDTEANAIDRYYPGDDYVDYVAIDGFNFGDPWESFDQIFSDALIQLKEYNKPVYILSMASASGQKKSEWITDALGTQVYLHPEIKGWVWFNQNKERDWRVNSDSESLSAFKSVIP